MPGSAADPVLDIRDLRKYYPIRRGVLRRTVGWVRAVDGVSFQVRRGETVGLVGESGCGKTTLLRTLVRAVDPTGGTILFQRDGEAIDVARAEGDQLNRARQAIRMVFQDPESSLNPRMTVRRIVAEPLVINRSVRSKAEVERRTRELVVRVGLKPEHLNRYPYAFSGGQRQRIGVARALALEPALLLADEPTSALDVSVQAQILNLLMELQREMQLAIIFVTHDLSVVRHMASRVAVMYLGNIVEMGTRQEIFANPRHPYTEALFSAIPQPDPHRSLRRIELEGDIPEITAIPPGCPFHPRCGHAQEQCRSERAELRAVVASGAEHHSACHFAGELNLKGEADLLGAGSA
jgi:peptide/nickel transport system ATP-binding protein